MNHWEKNHGKARRAIDRALLKECEKQIDDTIIDATSPEQAEKWLRHQDGEQAEMRARIARALGREPQEGK